MLPSPDTTFGSRVRERLSAEIVLWLTTVGADGTPQPNPVWFLWEGGDSLLVYNRADANRVKHIRTRPRVALNFDGNGRGGDIIVLTGDAELVDDVPPANEHKTYAEKYAAEIARVFGTPESFASKYPVAIRIHLTRVR